MIHAYAGIQIIESVHCLQTWQLNDFTKDLMGVDWVKQFDIWAEYSLPKQPACYMINRDKMVAHPLIVHALKSMKPLEGGDR